MKNYLKTIQHLQKFFLGISILIMVILPLIIVFFPQSLSNQATLRLYDISHFAVLLVMVVRPMADIFTQTNLIRPLVILRKGLGVLSASIVVSFILAKIMISPLGYFASIGTLKYWSFQNFAIFAHLADISAIFLIVTSNNFSKRILGNVSWKRIQRLSYVYFYASSIYVLFVFGNLTMLFSMFLVTFLTMVAYLVNQKRVLNKPNPIVNSLQPKFVTNQISKN
jgi:DMSO/TMAO reductase YedYZ heme-binding membrane subunit